MSLSAYNLYLQEVNRIPLLTRKEEVDLAKKAKLGDQKAIDKLVNANLRFVISIAKIYANQGLDLEDLINEGNRGLVRAAHRFDEERGFKFVTYAVWWIKQAMRRALAEQSRAIRVPIHRAGQLHQIGKVEQLLTQELGCAPNDEEIAVKLGLPIELIRETRSIAALPLELNATLTGETTDEAVALQPDPAALEPFDDVLMSQFRRDFDRATENFSERERRILTWYFGLDGGDPMTLEEIGQRFHLTRERIRQIKGKALKRLQRPERAKHLRSYHDA